MAMMIGQDSALELIGPERRNLLLECVDAGWQAWAQEVRPHLPLCSPRGLANVVHELVVHQARSRLTPELGFRIDDPVSGGRFLAIVDGRLLLQFKKLTIDLCTRNNPTDTSRAFDRQERGIEGIPDLPRLTVGWQLGQYATELSEVYLAFLVGDEAVWYYNLRNGEQSTALDFGLPEGPSPAEEEAAAAWRNQGVIAVRKEEGGTK